MIQALQSAADLEPLAILRVVAVALAISLVLAFLQNVIRNVTWSIFHFVAAFFAYLCRALLQFVNFLSARSSEALDGLAEEGKYDADDPSRGSAGSSSDQPCTAYSCSCSWPAT